MADKQIKQLTEATSLEPNDLFLVQLDSDSTTKKVKASNAFAGGWISLENTLTYSSNDGNKQATYTVSSTDVTGTLQEGMKIKLPRPTAVGTQCADLEASSSQYASKSSPSGITFTDDFSCGGWIKLESIGGGNQTILARKGAGTAAGWEFVIENTSGQLKLRAGNNAGSLDFGITNQSIPVGEWVFVVATLDLSGTTSTTYINGISVANSYSSGTSTTITQSGNLTLGSSNAPDAYFDGKIKHAFVADKILSEAEVKEAMVSDDLTTASFSSNLDAYFKLEGDFTDSSANSNDLTAQNSAVATNADSPFSSTEYGIITSASFSTDTTLTVFFGSGNPVNENVTAPAYSTHRVPYGFPADKGKWTVRTVDLSGTKISATTGSYSNFNSIRIQVPVGAWDLGYSATGNVSSGASAILRLYVALSESSSSVSDISLQSALYLNAMIEGLAYLEKSRSITIATPTTYYMVIGGVTGQSIALRGDGIFGYTTVTAECAYL